MKVIHFHSKQYVDLRLVCREVRRLVPNSVFHLNRVPPHMKKQPDYPPRTCFNITEQKMVTYPRVGAFEFRFLGESTPFFSSLQTKMHPDKTYILALILGTFGEKRTKLPQINPRIQSKTPDMRTPSQLTNQTITETPTIQRTFYFDKMDFDKIDIETFGRKTQNTFMRLRLPKVDGASKQVELPPVVQTSTNFKEEVKAFKLTIKDRLRALDKLSEKKKPNQDLVISQENETVIKEVLAGLYELVLQHEAIIDHEIKLLPVDLSRLYDKVLHEYEQLQIQKENELASNTLEFVHASYMKKLYQNAMNKYNIIMLEGGEQAKKTSILQINLRRLSGHAQRRVSQNSGKEDPQEEHMNIDNQPMLIVSQGTHYQPNMRFQSHGLVEFAAHYKTLHVTDES